MNIYIASLTNLNSQMTSVADDLLSFLWIALIPIVIIGICKAYTNTSSQDQPSSNAHQHKEAQEPKEMNVLERFPVDESMEDEGVHIAQNEAFSNQIVESTSPKIDLNKSSPL